MFSIGCVGILYYSVLWGFAWASRDYDNNTYSIGNLLGIRPYRCNGNTKMYLCSRANALSTRLHNWVYWSISDIYIKTSFYTIILSQLIYKYNSFIDSKALNSNDVLRGSAKKSNSTEISLGKTNALEKKCTLFPMLRYYSYGSGVRIYVSWFVLGRPVSDIRICFTSLGLFPKLMYTQIFRSQVV